MSFEEENRSAICVYFAQGAKRQPALREAWRRG